MVSKKALTGRSALGELWGCRELVAVLVARDLKLRTKRSALGMAWTLLGPLLQMAIYTIVFSMVLQVGVPGFPLFVLSGLLPWSLLAVSAAAGSVALLDNQALIRKVAVPQSVYPLAVVGSKLVDVVLSLVPLAVVAAFLGRPPGPSWVLLLPAALIAAGFAAGLALALSSLTVFFRDVRHLVEVGLQLWFYATPILYPPSALARIGHPALRALLAANPAAPIVALFQAAAYEGRAPDGSTALAAVASAGISLAGGLLLFRALEPRHVLHF